jgi:hypothetical protein
MRASSLVLFLAACSGDVTATDPAVEAPRDAATKARSGVSTGILYHGGPIMLGGQDVYLVWYGGWTGDPATGILEDLVQAIGGSRYYNINTTYFDRAGHHVTNAVYYGGSVTDAYSHGKTLSDTDVLDVVDGAIAAGKLPDDPDAVYFVLASADVNESSGFCTQYCAWHWNDAADRKIGFVGDADRCPSACEAQTASSPNGDPGADAMASSLSHELEEAATDPLGNAWYDRRGEENADKCAWTYGTTYRAANGSFANMHLGSRDYLIQQNWLNVGAGKCVLSY